MSQNPNQLQVAPAEATQAAAEFDAQAARRVESVVEQIRQNPSLGGDFVGVHGEWHDESLKLLSESEKVGNAWAETFTAMSEPAEAGGVQVVRSTELTGGGDGPASYALRRLETVMGTDGTAQHQVTEYALQPGLRNDYERTVSVRVGNAAPQSVAVSRQAFETQTNAIISELQHGISHADAARHAVQPEMSAAEVQTAIPGLAPEIAAQVEQPDLARAA